MHACLRVWCVPACLHARVQPWGALGRGQGLPLQQRMFRCFCLFSFLTRESFQETPENTAAHCHPGSRRVSAVGGLCKQEAPMWGLGAVGVMHGRRQGRGLGRGSQSAGLEHLLHTWPRMQRMGV